MAGAQIAHTRNYTQIFKAHSVTYLDDDYPKEHFDCLSPILCT